MNRKELAVLAREECNNPENIIHCGQKGKIPFWNQASRQFMYIPAFQFLGIPGCECYRYDAIDEQGLTHSFKATYSEAPLTPIWQQLPEGVVRLTVTALNPDGTDYAVVGAKTFFKLASFPEETPKAVRSYEESANMALEFAFNQPFIQHWLKYGTPDPGYDLNTYPSKIIASLVNAMIDYSKLNPEAKEDAMKVAVSAADWLISITPRGDHPLANVPPTYYLDFCPDAEKYGIITPNYEKALEYKGTVMMIYPASAGMMYLNLYAQTGEKKYLNEALNIGKFYLDTVEDCGSWYLVRSEETGEPTAPNIVSPTENVLPFLTKLYDVTKDEVWKELCEKAVLYTVKKQWNEFDWEGQFEDIGLSVKYDNLSQYGPVGLAIYYLKYHRDEPEYIEKAKELMRFAEDQFVIWNRPTPWGCASKTSLEQDENASKWHTPCALEQYHCYVPIDGSASHIISGFLGLYEAGCGELYLAKARVLADQMTIMQEESGRIPTFWIDEPGPLSNFWYNCLFASCDAMLRVAKYKDIVLE